MIEIPNSQTKQLVQNNKSDIFGSIDTSFNLDLRSNEGAVRVNRTIKNFDSVDQADLTTNIVAFERFNGDIYALADDVWKGGGYPSSTFTDEAGGFVINPFGADMKEFNGYLYVSTIPQLGGNMNIHKRDTAGTWTNPITVGSSTGVSILEKYGDSIYVTLNGVEVRAISQADVLSTTTGTLDLGIPTDNYPDGSVITMLKAGNDRLWIGVTAKSGNEGTVYTWDGETENTPTNSYKLDYGIMAGTVKDGVPYVLDARGRLLAFNGASFQEVGSLPFDKYALNGIDQDSNIRSINTNGMTYSGDEILVNVSNVQTGEIDRNPDLPSGVWAWSPTNGFYHKYSATNSKAGDIDDYGQVDIERPGALAVFLTQRSLPNNGTLLFGAQFYTSTTNTEYGIFYNDIIDTEQKVGSFTTSKIFSSSIEDTWQKVYVTHRKLLDSADKITVKFRTEDVEPTKITLTWSDEKTFLTNEDLSAYEQGDEVLITRGRWAGRSSRIESITSHGSGYTVILEDTFTGSTGSVIARVTNYKQAGTITDDDDKDWKAITFADGNKSTWVQIKVEMRFTGEDELYKLRIINKPNINE